MKNEFDLADTLVTTLIFCWPTKHEGPCDMTGWVDIVEPTTGHITGGSAVCSKCGMMAISQSLRNGD